MGAMLGAVKEMNQKRHFSVSAKNGVTALQLTVDSFDKPKIENPSQNFIYIIYIYIFIYIYLYIILYLLPNSNCKNSVNTVIFLLFGNCQLSTVTLSKQYDVNKYHHKNVIRMMAK